MASQRLGPFAGHVNNDDLALNHYVPPQTHSDTSTELSQGVPLLSQPDEPIFLVWQWQVTMNIQQQTDWRDRLKPGRVREPSGTNAAEASRRKPAHGSETIFLVSASRVQVTPKRKRGFRWSCLVKPQWKKHFGCKQTVSASQVTCQVGSNCCINSVEQDQTKVSRLKEMRDLSLCERTATQTQTSMVSPFKQAGAFWEMELI